MERSQHEPSGPGLRVVLYLRQSDREQRLSLAQQRQECRTYALSRGWVVVAEYVDDGKSGSKEVAKREQWHRLIADAQQPDRNWDAILCWDTSRFGRLDALAGAEYKQKLRKAGVWLETVRGERIDWSTSMGRIMDALSSERDHEYSTNISSNVVRGRRAVLDLGYWATRVPYGFDRQYVEGNQVRMVVPRQQVFSKPRNWRLLPVANESEAGVIQWLFGQWRDRDLSFGLTIKMLMAKQIPSPSGRASWTLHQVKTVLTEQAYVGDAVIGSGEKTQEVHNRIGKRVKADAFPALIDRRTFEIVQKKVQEREGAEWRPKSNSGPLSGVCKCGHCGYVMARRTYKGRTKYVCESSLRRPHLGCKQWRIDEAEILPLVCQELVQSVDFAILEALNKKADTKSREREIQRLGDEKAKLNRQLERAAKNILLVDPDNFPEAQKALNHLRKDHERVANALLLAQTDTTPEEASELAQAWGQSKKVVEFVARQYQTYPPNPRSGLYASIRVVGQDHAIQADVETFRELLRRLRVEVHFFWERRGQRNWALTTGQLRAQFDPPQVNNRELDVSSQITGTRAHPTRRAAGRQALSR